MLQTYFCVLNKKRPFWYWSIHSLGRRRTCGVQKSCNQVRDLDDITFTEWFTPTTAPTSGSSTQFLNWLTFAKWTSRRCFFYRATEMFQRLSAEIFRKGETSEKDNKKTHPENSSIEFMWISKHVGDVDKILQQFANNIFARTQSSCGENVRRTFALCVV